MYAFSLFMPVLGFALSIGYVFLCAWLVQGWRQLPVWSIPEGYRPGVSITVLMPARNEAACIRESMEAVLNQSYPRELLEIIVIDDHSDDDTASIVQQMAGPTLRLLRMSEQLLPAGTQSFKKKAIEAGISHAKGELIVTTDADCIAPPNWLLAVASLYESRRPSCILAPVGHFREASFLERFQSLDMAGLMLCSGALANRGLPLLANGANLAYAKSAFEAVGGFSGIDHLASGDDLMLVHKLAAQFPGEVLFLKHAGATVLTSAKPDWRSFWQQRIRWATKTNHYRRPAMTAVLAGIFLLCVMIAVLPFSALLLGRPAILTFIALFSIKAAADYLLLREACRFFHRTDLLRKFLLSEGMHIAYMVGTGIMGNVVKQYEWKGRKVR